MNRPTAIRTRFLTILYLAVFLAAPALMQVALAQNKTPVVNERESDQKARLKQGVKSGELNKREANRLAAEQAKIHAEERIAKSDGKVTAKERAKIQHDQNKASRHIYKQKHDKQSR